MLPFSDAVACNVGCLGSSSQWGSRVQFQLLQWGDNSWQAGAIFEMERIGVVHAFDGGLPTHLDGHGADCIR